MGPRLVRDVAALLRQGPPALKVEIAVVLSSLLVVEAPTYDFPEARGRSETVARLGCIVAYYSSVSCWEEMYQSIKHQGKKLALPLREELAKKTRRQLAREDAEFSRCEDAF